MKLCILVVVLAHYCRAEVNNVTSGAFYEYDTDKNGWYNGSPSGPIMVNLRPHRYPGVPDRYYDFVNRTVAKQPAGICFKEIP